MKAKDVIINELNKVDRKYSEYQNLHVFFYNERDEEVKVIYNSIIRVYKELLDKIKYED